MRPERALSRRGVLWAAAAGVIALLLAASWREMQAHLDPPSIVDKTIAEATLASLPGYAPDFAPAGALLVSPTDDPEAFAQIVAGAHRRVPVIALVPSTSVAAHLKAVLQARQLPTDGVRFVTLPLDTVWVGDYGPMFIRRPNGSVAVVDPDYVASGNRPNDDRVPTELARRLALPVQRMPLFLERGNFLTNGAGLCATTHAIYLRNDHLGYTPQVIGEMFGEYLGMQRWVQLDLLEGEPTGHVDLYLAFLAPNLAVVGQYNPKDDPENARRLDAVAERLSALQTPHGPLRVHRIPMPPRTDGVWRTYTNVLIANQTLFVPVYSDVDPALQRRALDLYARLLPDWKIVPVTCDRMIRQAGALHCLAMTVPAWVPLDPLLK